MDKNPKKILVFCPNWMGDVLFITPLFEAVKKKYPSSLLGAALPGRCGTLLLNNPFVDEIIPFNEREEHSSPRKKLLFIAQLMNKHYDTVLLLHRSLTRTIICRLAGIRRRVGYAYPKRRLLLTDKKVPVDKDSIHKQDYYLSLSELIGVPAPDKNCRMFLSDDERRQAQETIAASNALRTLRVAISPFTNWSPKDWPLENYETLIKLIAQKIPNAVFFITARNSTPSLREMTQRMKGYKMIDLAGKTSLRELAALYEKMSIVAAGDSGPLHIAAAVNTLYVGLYGATSPELTSPRTDTPGTVLYKNHTCPTPCYERNCIKDNACMKAITPQDAADALFELLNR